MRAMFIQAQAYRAQACSRQKNLAKTLRETVHCSAFAQISGMDVKGQIYFFSAAPLKWTGSENKSVPFSLLELIGINVDFDEGRRQAIFDRTFA